MTLFDIAYDDFKREDTTNVITITLYTDDRQPITPNASHTWKAKVSKGDKYVGEYPVTISGNTIKLSSSNLTRLPNGDYGLELWETYSGSTTIYPSAGVMEFRVHRNANDTLGTVDPTTDINAIIDDLHKAGQNIKVVATNTLPAGSKASVTQSITNGENQLTFNIPQGIQGEQGNVGPAPTLKIGTVTKLNSDQTPTASLSGGNGAYALDLGIPQGGKGETGTVDNAGLTTAPGFVELKTRVDNSAVGTNLVAQSDLKGGYFDINTGSSNAIGSYDFHSDNYIPTNGATVFTFSSPDYVFKGGINSTLIMYDSDKNFLGYQKITSATQTLSKSNVAYIKFSVNFVQEGGTAGELSDWLSSHRYKLEKGSVATDWCPNPSEILTQADYAKIQAAIVALGGSLK